MIVYLVGVDHRIMWIPETSGPGWIKAIDEFKKYIQDKCLDYEIELVAEEFSQYVVDINPALDSTARHAASSIEVDHLFCDPDPDERDLLKIVDVDMREFEWMHRLEKSRRERVLFVCGDSHIASFTKKLIDNGHVVISLSTEWGVGWQGIN